MPGNGDRLLRPIELAERQGKSVGTLANDRSSGRGIPYVKLGSSVRYRLSDVIAYEDANRVETLDSLAVA